MDLDASDQESAASLLQLPNPCLVAVLHCCANKPRTVCSAVRAHSRLHQAAVHVLTSITLNVKQQQVDNLTEVYFPSYGKHIDSISLELIKGDWWGDEEGDKEAAVTMQQLPATLTKLSSLNLQNMVVQLQPRAGFQGVLGAAAVPPLKQLRLNKCTLLDGEEGPAAALAMLPDLEHLSIRDTYYSTGGTVDVPLHAVIPRLQQLTYLEIEVRDRSEQSIEGLDDHDAVGAVGAVDAVLQHLTALTGLADLHLTPDHPGCSMTASMLSGAQHLTRWDLNGYVSLEPAALAGRTLLQHLNMCLRPGGAASTAQLLRALQQLQQLTCLILSDNMQLAEATTPAAAYSALTASSKLQVLEVCYWRLPADVWQHVFPAGRQLPHMQSLQITEANHPAAAPEGTRLVSCCPGLRTLHAEFECIRGLLAGLQGLGSLTALSLKGSSEGLEGVGQLIGLRRLEVGAPPDVTIIDVLAQLRQLTHFSYWASIPNNHGRTHKTFQSEAPGDKPVWRQVLLRYLNDSDPQVAKRAAAALVQAEVQPL